MKLTFWVQRFLHVWFLLSRPMTLGVRGILYNSEGSVLFVKHSYSKGWQLPGGGVEVGEDAVEALTREMREEVGIEITQQPELLKCIYNKEASRRDHVLIYRVSSFEELKGFERPLEIADACFFNPDELPKDMATESIKCLNLLALKPQDRLI